MTHFDNFCSESAAIVTRYDVISSIMSSIKPFYSNALTTDGVKLGLEDGNAN